MHLMVGARKEQKARSRRALMDAALSLVSARRRFSELSLREVTRAAGVTPPAFYRHFADMDALGLALIAEASDHLRGLISSYRDGLPPGASPVRACAELFVTDMRANAAAFRLLVQEVTGTNPVLRRSVRRDVERYIEAMAAEISAQVTPELRRHYDARLVAEAITVIGFGIAADALDRSDAAWELARERIVAHARNAAAGAMAGARAAFEHDQLTGPASP